MRSADLNPDPKSGSRKVKMAPKKEKKENSWLEHLVVLTGGLKGSHAT
jgi:hypothetical protein